ncbi:MAG: hypothetical protein ACR2KB_02055 [Chitinophagaceae bacterium]
MRILVCILRIVLLMKNSFSILIVFLAFATSTFSQSRSDTTFSINGQNFSLTLVTHDPEQLPLNTILTIWHNGNEMFSDSVFSQNGYYEFLDINDDGFDDLLVYQSIGARANETFNLYLYRSDKKDLKKIINYNDWPNMQKTQFKGIVCATILTGSIQYKFFEITDNGDLIDLNVSVEEYKYDGRGYWKGIRKIKRIYPNTKKVRSRND